MKYAILIHVLGWNYSDKIFEIDDGISLVKLDGHPANQLYHRLCNETGLDHGDPYMFNSALILHDKTNEDPSFPPTSSPRCLSSIFVNILAILNKRPVGFCKIIASNDDFQTSVGVFELYDALTEDFYEFNEIRIDLTEKNLSQIQQIWKNLRLTWNSQHTRIDNALTFYYLSWNAHTLQQTAISLSIVLETLFSPDSNNELSHQISFNVSKFTASAKDERIENYKLVKKYYSIRSKLVHGEAISEKEVETIPNFFEFLSDILLKIITSSEWIILFNDNDSRKKYLKDLLFEP